MSVKSLELVSADELLVPDHSGARRAAVRAFRPRRVVPSVLAASLLILAGATVAAQVVFSMLGHPPLPQRTVRPDDPGVMGAAACVAFAGLLLLLSAMLPGRTRTVPLTGDDPAFVIGLRRSSLRSALAAESLLVPGVDEVNVRLRGRLRPCATVRAFTSLRNPGDLAGRLSDAVRDRLDELDPVRRTRVAVHLSHRKD